MIPKIKEVDQSAVIVLWKRDRGNLKNLNGKELDLVPKDVICHYVRVPNGGRRLIDGRTYYQVGMCIMTGGMSVQNFTNSWSNKKITVKMKIKETNGGLSELLRYRVMMRHMRLVIFVESLREDFMIL